MTMTSVYERELEETVDRYCDLVTVMEQSPVGATDFQALYSKVKAAQERFIQQKCACTHLPTYQGTEQIRGRFKAAHARMRALEQRLKEQGIVLLVPPAEARCLVFPPPLREGVRRGLPICYEIIIAVVGVLLFITGLLVGLHRTGYL